MGVSGGGGLRYCAGRGGTDGRDPLGSQLDEDHPGRGGVVGVQGARRPHRGLRTRGRTDRSRPLVDSSLGVPTGRPRCAAIGGDVAKDRSVARGRSVATGRSPTRRRRHEQPGALQHLVDLRLADRPEAQHERPVRGAVHDGRLHPHRTGPTVDDQVADGVEPTAELLDHVSGPGGADPAEAVRARRGDATGGVTGQRRQRCQARMRDRVARAAQRHGVLASGEVVTGPGAALHHQGQRPGPERLGQGAHAAVGRCRPALERSDAGHVHDQRMVGRASLGRVDARNRRGILGVSGQAVDGLGGQPDQPAGQPRARHPLGDRGIRRAVRAQAGENGDGHPHDSRRGARRPARLERLRTTTTSGPPGRRAATPQPGWGSRADGARVSCAAADPRGSA